MSGVKKTRRSAGGSRKRKPATIRVATRGAQAKKPEVARKPATAKKAASKTKTGTAKNAARGRVTNRPTARKAVEQTVVRVRDLDPYRKCGPGTSVERLIRVDELVDRQPRAHLVYLDRHGWYCEHGRSCPAVGHARRHASRVGRPGW